MMCFCIVLRGLFVECARFVRMLIEYAPFPTSNTHSSHYTKHFSHTIKQTRIEKATLTNAESTPDNASSNQ